MGGIAIATNEAFSEQAKHSFKDGMFLQNIDASSMRICLMMDIRNANESCIRGCAQLINDLAL